MTCRCGWWELADFVGKLPFSESFPLSAEMEFYLGVSAVALRMIWSGAMDAGLV